MFLIVIIANLQANMTQNLIHSQFSLKAVNVKIIRIILLSLLANLEKSVVYWDQTTSNTVI